MAALRLGFSPCPNDTFVFHHLLREHARDFRWVVEDVEELNARAERDELDVAKVSVAAYGRLRDGWALLRAGGAAGYGVGPIVVSAGREGRRVAIPGARTTAALLLRLLGDFDTVPMRFDRIEDAVLAGEVDMGVLIHEGRFTYEGKGLSLVADLGALWERRMQVPIPLGAIAVRRALGAERAAELENRLVESVRFARSHPDASRDFVRHHAQEMDPDVTRRHIELYVNDYTVRMDEPAVHALLRFGAEQDFFAASDAPLFLHD